MKKNSHDIEKNQVIAINKNPAKIDPTTTMWIEASDQDEDNNSQQSSYAEAMQKIPPVPVVVERRQS